MSLPFAPVEHLVERKPHLRVLLVNEPLYLIQVNEDSPTDPPNTPLLEFVSVFEYHPTDRRLGPRTDLGKLFDCDHSVERHINLQVAAACCSTRQLDSI